MNEIPSRNLHFIHPDSLNRGGGLTRKLQELAIGDTMMISNHPLALDVATSTSYTDRPDYREGRADSMHNVGFADLQINGENGIISTLPVAIKPMDEEWLASREIRTALALNEIEAGVTFRPVGFLRQPDTKLAVLTQFDEGVTSFDNTLWEKDYIPTKREVEWALSCAAASLVFLHANGYTHGDFQVKNTAYSGASLQSRIIDTTSTKRSADINAFGDDISLYVESLGRFGQQNSHARREDVLEYFIEPYADSIEDIFPKSKQEDMRKIMANLALNMDEVLLGGEFN